ncbi:DUF1684 domain-containing protein [Jannaschia sp. Os4]|nr:DUF1684 domain-containing protein [Jannaschia sp. Os4]
MPDWRRRVQDLHARVRATPDPQAAWRDWHATRSRLFHEHPLSPLPADSRRPGAAIPVFPYDPALRFAVALDPRDGPAEPVELGADGTLVRRPVGRTRGLSDALGAEIAVWWIGGYGGGLFVPLRDGTSGTETYGAGRYLIDAIKGADLGTRDGRLILDLNFAYHPSCAWNPAYTCPLAPPENAVPARVEAGERMT